MRTDENIVYGTLRVRLLDASGRVKDEQVVNNLITDAGDLYQATRIASGVNGNTLPQPTLVTGMKLGTGTTAPAKNGVGSVLISYLSGSNRTFDIGFPIIENLGPGAGVNVSYRCTWPAGVSTSTSINEVSLVNNAASNLNSADVNTISRSVLTATINKLATESLEITWNHKMLGA